MTVNSHGSLQNSVELPAPPREPSQTICVLEHFREPTHARRHAILEQPFLPVLPNGHVQKGLLVLAKAVRDPILKTPYLSRGREKYARERGTERKEWRAFCPFAR